MGRISGSNANILLAYAMEASLVEWSLFEDFLTLAQSANFSRAADLRHMTQPAFSRRIRSLEEWVGAPLFDRTCHPVALTEAGRRFLPAAQETLQRLDQVCEECRETARAASATLHFAATHSLSLAFFPSWLRDLEAAGPLGAIRLTSDSLQGCEQTMLQGLAQFLLRATTAPPPRAAWTRTVSSPCGSAETPWPPWRRRGPAAPGTPWTTGRCPSSPTAPSPAWAAFSPGPGTRPPRGPGWNRCSPPTWPWC